MKLGLSSLRSGHDLVVTTLFLGTLLTAGRAQAFPNGIASSDLPSLVVGCNGCHTDPVNVPAVTLTASSVALQPGQQITLTLTVTTVNGDPGGAGFNIRSSQQGVFAVGGESSANTRVLVGTNGWSEATHTIAKQGEPATFTLLWTPSAATIGSVTFTAWGNAVDLSTDNLGDHAASTTLGISICAPTLWYPDADGDSFGAAAGPVSACAAPAGYVSSNTDCDDTRFAVKPGAAESCNGIDDNCAGGVDEGNVCGDAATGAPDALGDADAAPDSGSDAKSGCGCRIAQRDRPTSLLLVAALWGVVLHARRRRRST